MGPVQGREGPRIGRGWLGPALALTALSLGAAAAVYLAAGGQEIADDAPHFLEFVRDPFVLWGNYREAGISDRWGSFPPLLPVFFSALVAPWTWVLSDFWAIRIGVLCWTLVALWLLSWHLGSRRDVSDSDQRLTLWVFVLVPSVWAAAALIPQEEIYASLFVFLLFEAATARRWTWISPLLLLTVAAGKYFLLILLIPLACLSPRPIRSLLLYGCVSVSAILLYVGYHWMAHGLVPILSYSLEPSAAISVWGLLWNLDIQPPPQISSAASVLLCAATVLALSLFARRHAMEPSFLLAISLILTILMLSISVPGYLLWALPLILVCLARTAPTSRRIMLIAGLFGWGLGEWSANFFRGVRHNLAAGAGGKGTLARNAQSVLGADFPLDALHVGCIALVIASGVLLAATLVTEGLRPTTPRHGREWNGVEA